MGTFIVKRKQAFLLFPVCRLALISSAQFEIVFFFKHVFAGHRGIVTQSESGHTLQQNPGVWPGRAQ